MDIAEKIGLILLGVVLSAMGYLIKRLIEKKSQIEALDKQKKLLDIHKQMNDQGIDLGGLRALEQQLIGKAVAIQSKAVILRAESTPLVGDHEPKDLTQIELNERASSKFETAKKKMQEAIAGIDSRVGDYESQTLLRSQREWESYSVSQAEAAAASYREGSIYPLIYFSELESLTSERTARLQAELEELIRLGN